jgi:hypothetical protein
MRNFSLSLKINARAIALLFIFFNAHFAHAIDYYVHPLLGKDLNDGLTKTNAFKTLDKVNALSLKPGDRILLAGDQKYQGTLLLRKVMGTKDQPVTVSTLDWTEKGQTGKKALIDAKGYAQGVLIEDCSYVTLASIAITADGYTDLDSSSDTRSGVMIRTNKLKMMKGISISDVSIFDVFYENTGFKRGRDEVKTANGTQRYGWGIRIVNNLDDAKMENILIRNCNIKDVSHTGIKVIGNARNIQYLQILGNDLVGTGGPGIQLSNVQFAYVADNVVNRSGSPDDSRKWGRGSGLWTWGASHVLIERNKIMYANGPGDSAGAHIDYNCDNIVMQYNFSAHNAGGFCEVLGNNYNCAYRFNISVNDGSRIKGVDGAFQEGKIFWLSGYQGSKGRKGPVNTYFYNNTIYVNKDIVSKVAIDNTSEGLLIANNIFYLEGGAELVQGDQYKPDTTSNSNINRLFFENNLFLNASTWPAAISIKDSSPKFGDPLFKNGGGLNPEDYLPTNKALVNKGIKINYIPNDPFGLLRGLWLDKDFLGKLSSSDLYMGAIRP